MIKSNEETMTEDEIHVLTILEQHAKESIDRIAKRCDFSRQKVWKIVKHLEETKIIWGYSAITDTE
jgi:DNA-binding Lrp family transcriptional regulator